MRPWALQDGRVPWRQALSAVAVLTLAVGGPRPVVAAAARDTETGRLACAAPHPAVRLHLVDRAGLSTPAREELMRETVAPWRSAGDSVTWADRLPTRPAELGEPKDLYVFIEADADDTHAGDALPMASILFVQGQPTTHVTVHAGHVARRLASLRLEDRPMTEVPRLLRDRILGRVLGRAVAHEIGHFLSGSRAHDEAGLMRASHRIDHLLAPAHPSFAAPKPATPGCLVARSGEQP